LKAFDTENTEEFHRGHRDYELRQQLIDRIKAVVDSSGASTSNSLQRSTPGVTYGQNLDPLIPNLKDDPVDDRTRSHRGGCGCL
jgi:hypothetical protein